MDDDAESRRFSSVGEDQEEEGEVLFRGSQSYEKGLSEMAASEPQRRRGEGAAPRPLRKDTPPDSVEQVQSVPVGCRSRKRLFTSTRLTFL